MGLLTFGLNVTLDGCVDHQEDLNEIRVGGRGHPARLQVLTAADESQHDGNEQVFVCLERNAPELRPLRLRPSMAGSDGAIDYRILERVDLGGRIPILGKPDMAIVGEAVHSILAADRPDALRADREAKAQRILQRWSVPAIDPRDAIVCADRLWRFLRERFPEARIRREVPVHAVLGTQIVNGRLDLIVEGEDWFVIVDHKSFPGAPDRWDAKALGYAPQLALYGRAAEIATGKASRGYLVHMPLVGVVCEVGALELVG